MKKLLFLSFLLLIAALALTGCTSPGAADPEPTPEPMATPEPVALFIPPTPEPLVTPRYMEGVIEEPSPGATLILIDPTDKPTIPPIVFEPYMDVTEQALGLTFQVPSYWERMPDDENYKNTVIYQEPDNSIRSGTVAKSSVTIQMVLDPSKVQTIKDAEAYIDGMLENFTNDYYKNLDYSSKADNRVKGLGETGRYVTYRVDYYPYGEGGPSIRMRGRLLVVPVDRKLYMVRYICPAEHNVGPLTGDYTGGYEDVYKKIRETIKEI